MKKSVIKATAFVFLLSIVSKLIAFIKSIVQASFFGTTIETDAYNLANGFVSNIIYMLATAIAVAFVPLYIQNKQKGDEKQFANRAITLLTIGSIGFSGLMIVIAPLISRIIAPGYSSENLILTTRFFRVLLLGFTFALTTQLYTNLLNSEKKYGFSAFCSIINSVVLIAFILCFSDRYGIWALVISVPVSYFAQWIILFAKGKRYASITLKHGLFDSSLKVLVLQTVPILISQATVEINQVVDRALLTSVGEGALTAVSYSVVLFQFASSLISTPLSTVMFTELSEASASDDNSRVKKILGLNYKLLLIVCIPTMIVIFFIPHDIVNIVYGHGKFDILAVNNCAIGLRMYGFCLLPICLKTVLSRAFYAVNDTKGPMAIGILEVMLNIILSILLIKPFGIAGVVGATAIASVVFIVVLIFVFEKKHIRVIEYKDVKTYLKIMLATIDAIAVMVIIRDSFFVNPLIDFVLKTIITFFIFGITLVFVKEKTVFSILSMGMSRLHIERNQ